jgi:hypothetical protein
VVGFVLRSFSFLRCVCVLMLLFSPSCIFCVQCCQCLWTVHSWLPLWFSLTFNYNQQSVICLVYPMLPVSLDWPYTQRRKLKLRNTNPTTTLEMNPNDRQYICPIFNNSLALQWKLFAQHVLPYSNEWFMQKFINNKNKTNNLSYVLCTQCCQCLWIGHSWLPHWFSLTFIYYQQSVMCFVFPMLSVSLDWPFLITPSVSLTFHKTPDRLLIVNKR